MTDMTLVGKIKRASIQALKDGDKDTLNTLRLLIAELEKEKIQHKLTEAVGLSDEQAEMVILRSIKKLKKEAEAYASVGKGTEKQDKEIEVLKGYLPASATEEEIRKVVGQAIGMVERKEIKSPMQYISQALKGRAEMDTVMKIVKEMTGK